MTGAQSFRGPVRAAGSTVTVLALAAVVAGCTGAAPAPRTAAPSSVAAGPTMLADLRIGRNDGYDRVVLQFSGDAPRYAIAPAKGPVKDCASGAVVAGDGDYLVIRIDSIALFDDDGYSPYSGPKKVAGPGPCIGDATISCAFEGRLEVAVRLLGGAGRHSDSTVRDPGRIVLDVGTGGGA